MFQPNGAIELNSVFGSKPRTQAFHASIFPPRTLTAMGTGQAKIAGGTKVIISAKAFLEQPASRQMEELSTNT